MTDQSEPEVQTEELRLARIFFALPEPISLPDGYQVVMATGQRGLIGLPGGSRVG